MPFPETERVIYKNNPLREVVCEVKFPTILRVSAENPINFQERIRGSYPEYEVGNLLGPLVQNIPSSLLSLLQSKAQEHFFEAPPRGYRFSNSDQSWSITLSQESLSLSTSRYESWEIFRERFSSTLDALVDVYKPSYFSRIGLRYQNVISPQRLELDGFRWQELLSQPILGELASEEMQNVKVLDVRKIIVFSVEDGVMINLGHGFLENDEGQKDGYLIDTDHYQEGTIDTKECLENIERHHSYSRRIFRWCITDTLHDALGPLLA